MLPPLVRHGQFNGTPNPKKTGVRSSKKTKVYKPVTRYKKSRQAAETVNALGLISTTYKNAIEYRTIPSHVRGLSLFLGTIIGGLSVWCGWKFFSMFLDHGSLHIAEYILLSMVALTVLFGLMVFVFALRVELFRPIDEPVIFDREHGKVFLIGRAVAPGLSGLFKSWPVRAYEYKWKLIDAEYHMKTTTTGSTRTTWHSLLFIVRSSASNDKAIGTFHVAPPTLLCESTVGPFWEHIRRFMEEDGPHLPPGETRTYLEVPTSLWQSMGAVGPFGPNYFYWWKNHPFYSVVFHLFSPFIFPMCTAWAIMNWLSYLTAIDVQWPHEVAAAVGPDYP